MTTDPAAAPYPRLVYRLCHADDWRAAALSGVFEGTDVDTRDGYIHLSEAGQVEDTARLHYAGVRPLMLLIVDGEKVAGDLRWEPSRGGALFPHLYGTIPLEAVMAALPVPEDREGHLMFPTLSNSPGDLGL
ncbi:DUF952 domain-containing protein [Roseospira navarrensis]|uniref:DUF952 domain-containing protein n=1 Tax=Roseospira navarrensis TaxID=140058 RepID=A0A7X1ZF05_9PROT|nr:DUF952 domain-containing protein [Roseospira navarrensis]MQX37107.1 DUF952 domain-containing protein [Roseospira navarrensis]